MADGHMDDGREHAAKTPAAPGARPIELSGSSYAFNPPEITVRAGEEVAIVLTATDMAHVSTEAGETAEGGLRADEPGTYTYYCSVEGTERPAWWAP